MNMDNQFSEKSKVLIFAPLLSLLSLCNSIEVQKWSSQLLMDLATYLTEQT